MAHRFAIQKAVRRKRSATCVERLRLQIPRIATLTLVVSMLGSGVAGCGSDPSAAPAAAAGAARGGGPASVVMREDPPAPASAQPPMAAPASPSAVAGAGGDESHGASAGAAAKPVENANAKPEPAAKPEPSPTSEHQDKPRALPAAVCKVLQQNGCVTCHQAKLRDGAPMPLQWHADFMGETKDGTAMATKVLERIADANSPMPPPSSTRPMMPSDQRAVLHHWIESGMTSGEGTACEPGVEAADNLPAWTKQPWPEAECEYVLTVGAHGVSGTPLKDDTTPFPTPAAETTYHCFYEKVPWGDKPVQALATRVRLEGDDNEIVHHMVLSALDGKSGMSLLGGETPTAGGQHHDCANQSGSTIGLWGPGTQNPLTLPSDVGMLLPSGPNAFIELQVHYNLAKDGQQSRAAYEICATTKLRPQTAAVHWLGFENAGVALALGAVAPDLVPRLDNQGHGVAVGHCSVKQRAHILALQPHMHKLGRHAKVELERADGTTRVLHDAPFSFMAQTMYYQNDLWVDPGESVRSTCTWDTSRKIAFGLGSEEEMCFVYALAYPVGALSGQGAEAGVVGGALNCAGSE